MLLVNLRMDAVNVKENMRINWVSEAGMVENIQVVVKEYKDTRNLHVSHYVPVPTTFNSLKHCGTCSSLILIIKNYVICLN